MPRILRVSPRLIAAVFITSFVILWGIATYIRPTLAGRRLRSFSPFYNDFPSDAFNFTAQKPPWLAPVRAPHFEGSSSSSKGPAPLVLRIAVISHPEETDRRDAIRANVFSDLPTNEVKIDYRFFVGRTNGQRLHKWSMTTLDEMVEDEQAKYGDMHVLKFKESSSMLGVKRHAALQWAALADPSSYDHFLTFDSDSFIRLAALSRRALHMGIDDKHPRTRLMAWAHTQWADWHWHLDPAGKKDVIHHGEGFNYPLGIAYLLSSKLTAQLASAKLPTHIDYPFDDVLIGSWIQEHAPETEIVHDPAGFHNPEKEWQIVPIDWDTVCIHHSNPVEMRALRNRAEFADEWVPKPTGNETSTGQ